MGGFLYWSEIKGVLPLLLPKKRNRKKVFFICYADSKLKDSLCLLIFILEVAILFATYITVLLGVGKCQNTSFVLT